MVCTIPLGKIECIIQTLYLRGRSIYPVGKYGRMRGNFLKAHRTGTYTSLLMTEKLNAHLYEIDTLVHQRVDEIMAHMAKVEGTDEALKGKDQMA